jgi:hypothetical protein
MISILIYQKFSWPDLLSQIVDEVLIMGSHMEKQDVTAFRNEYYGYFGL